jgi:hypothetical protein
MTSSADVVLLSKIAELACRFGLRPSEADGELHFIDNDDRGRSHFELVFCDPNVDVSDEFDRMMKSLGCDSTGIITVQHLRELEDIVDTALSKAPRLRAR